MFLAEDRGTGSGDRAWRDPMPRGWTARVDFFGVALDASQVPDAIAIRSTALDEGRARDLRRAQAFREAPGRPRWQVEVYEPAFADAWSGNVRGEDDAALVAFERLYPDPDAVVMRRAAGLYESDPDAVAHLPEPRPDHAREGAAAWGTMSLDTEVAVSRADEDRLVDPAAARPDAASPQGPGTGQARDGSAEGSQDPSPRPPDGLDGRERRLVAQAVAAAREALAGLRGRRARESRARVAAETFARLRPDLGSLLDDGFEASEIEAAASEGGLVLGRGWAQDCAGGRPQPQ